MNNETIQSSNLTNEQTNFNNELNSTESNPIISSLLQIFIKTNSFNVTQPIYKNDSLATVNISTTTITPTQSSTLTTKLDTTTIMTETSQTSTKSSLDSTTSTTSATVKNGHKKGSSEFNWSSIMNEDSEKTIYESFYELLDNSTKNI